MGITAYHKFFGNLSIGLVTTVQLDPDNLVTEYYYVRICLLGKYYVKRHLLGKYLGITYHLTVNMHHLFEENESSG